MIFKADIACRLMQAGLIRRIGRIGLIGRIRPATTRRGAFGYFINGHKGRVNYGPEVRPALQGRDGYVRLIGNDHNQANTDHIKRAL